MTSPLVTGGFIALKSKLTGKYVRYMPDHGEGGKKILQASAENAVSPFTRFQAEPSKEHDDGGYVHLRCCYNGKYWVARQISGEWCLFGDADEPEEDLFKPSCTLFRRGSEYNSYYELYHGGFNKNIYILHDEDSSPTTKRRRSAYRLLLGDMDDRSNEDAYIFSVVDLNKQMALPRHVCFKANNDKYGRVAGKNNYIEFTSDDIGDPAVRHSIHPNGDGTVRVKSESLNRFWRLDPNWIKADYYSDSDDQVGEADAATLFRVVKVGDGSFALQSLGNNRYCKRLSYEGKTNCLNAGVPTITKEAVLRMEEAVLSRKIYGVEYHFADARIYSQKALTVATARAANRTGGEHKANLTLRYGVTRESRWESSVSVKISVSTKIEAGVPGIVAGELELQSEYVSSYLWGETDTRAEEHSVDYEMPVPANTALKLRVLATQGTCNVPFSYYQEDVLTTGEKVVTKFDDGIYRGVNSYDFTYEVTEEELSGVSAA